ncbi:hypothetical protein BJV78DRAFT_1236791 [Lactifluus subvellereus]|nr:hypothetical protein BJV78DRAFT_1236791 [Lactifluus subvellereus]
MLPSSAGVGYGLKASEHVASFNDRRRLAGDRVVCKLRSGFIRRYCRRRPGSAYLKIHGRWTCMCFWITTSERRCRQLGRPPGSARRVNMPDASPGPGQCQCVLMKTRTRNDFMTVLGHRLRVYYIPTRHIAAAAPQYTLIWCQWLKGDVGKDDVLASALSSMSWSWEYLISV